MKGQIVQQGLIATILGIVTIVLLLDVRAKVKYLLVTKTRVEKDIGIKPQKTIKKPSKGVILLGIFLIVQGFLGVVTAIFHNWAFYNNRVLWAKVFEFTTQYQSDLLGRFSSSQVSPIAMAVQIYQLLDEIKEYVFLSSFLLPTLSVIVLLGGIGLMRLKNVWRKIILFLLPLWYLTKIVIGNYYVGIIMAMINVGSVIKCKDGYCISHGLHENFLIGQVVFLKSFICPLIVMSTVLFFLTRKNVKIQFEGR